MADVIDEYGNPIQLTDERGNPVQLTDEHGNPMHLTGVAITHTNVSTAGSTLPPCGAGGGVGDTNVMSGPGTGVVSGKGMHGDAGETITDQPVHERGSSSSSSSEDDGQGGRRRKKKGLTQKIKEKFTGGKARDEHETVGPTVGTATTVTTHSEPHEKKGVMEKIKEKLPGGHHNH